MTTSERRGVRPDLHDAVISHLSASVTRSLTEGLMIELDLQTRIPQPVLALHYIWEIVRTTQDDHDD